MYSRVSSGFGESPSLKSSISLGSVEHVVSSIDLKTVSDYFPRWTEYWMKLAKFEDTEYYHKLLSLATSI